MIASRRSRYALEPASVSSARLTRSIIPLSVAACQSGEALLERLELLAHRPRQPVAEAREVLLGLPQLRPGLLEVDLQRLLDGVRVEPVERQRAHGGDVAQRRLAGLGLPVAAAEDPRQHARVLAEARPEKLAVVALAEPVDVEDVRKLGAL